MLWPVHEFFDMTGWYRHVLLCVCAHMSLLSITVRPHESAGQLLWSQIWQLPCVSGWGVPL